MVFKHADKNLPELLSDGRPLLRVLLPASFT